MYRRLIAATGQGLWSAILYIEALFSLAHEIHLSVIQLCRNFLNYRLGNGDADHSPVSILL